MGDGDDATCIGRIRIWDDRFDGEISQDTILLNSFVLIKERLIKNQECQNLVDESEMVEAGPQPCSALSFDLHLSERAKI
jgi:hypothetical protein